MGRLSGSAAAVLVALVGAAAMLVPSIALAAIYGWVDASGAMTYSNLPPPKDARVVVEIDDIAPPTPQAQAAADAAHASEMRALEERLHQLESERPRLSAYGPPPPAYSVPAPAYGPPPLSASYGPGCDPDYYDCYTWDGPPVYFTTVGAVPFRGFRHRDHDRDHDRDGFRHGFNHFPRTGGGLRFASGQRMSGFSASNGRPGR